MSATRYSCCPKVLARERPSPGSAPTIANVFIEKRGPFSHRSFKQTVFWFLAARLMLRDDCQVDIVICTTTQESRDALGKGDQAELHPVLARERRVGSRDLRLIAQNACLPFNWRA